MAEPLKNLAWDDFRLVKAIADAAQPAGRRGAARRQPLDGVPPARPDRGGARGQALRAPPHAATRLTTAGEEMVALAQRVDDDITAFTRKLAGREITPAGELRVTTNDSLLSIC